MPNISSSPTGSLKIDSLSVAVTDGHELYQSPYRINPAVTVVEDGDMSNSWVNFDTTRKVRYWKDMFGVVHLSGVIKSGTIGNNTVFTLPAGFLPDFVDGTNQVLVFPTVSNSLFGVAYIFYTGVVQAVVGSNVYFSFDGITFRAA